MSTLLSVSNVSKHFEVSGRTVKALSGVSFNVEKGECLAIVGESGSGKSTLGKMIVGLTAPTSGQVLVDGRDLSRLLERRPGRLEYRRKVQLVAQDTTTTFDPRRIVREAIRRPAQILGGLDSKAADDAVDSIVADLGIAPELVERYPHQLSGGQRQRLSIARALVVHPDILVCDEAVSALDVSAQAVVLNLLKDYVTTHSLGLVFISHGLPATAFITDDLLVMNRGQVVESGETMSLLNAPSNDYTQTLVGAYQAMEAVA